MRRSAAVWEKTVGGGWIRWNAGHTDPDGKNTGCAATDRDAHQTRVMYLLTYPLLLVYEQARIWPTVNALVERWWPVPG